MPDKRLWDPDWTESGPRRTDADDERRYEDECEKADRLIDKRKEEDNDLTRRD